MRILLLALLVTASDAGAAVVAIDPVAPAHEPATESIEAEPPQDIVLGRFALEPYVVSGPGGRHSGGRFGIDMVSASGDRATRLAGGIRFLIGGDGAEAFGTEGQLLVGVAHAISDRAVIALVVPLGFTLGGGNESFGPHGYVGIEGVAAVRVAGHTLELGAGVSNRGARARIGIVQPGKEVGFGVGFDWQRDGDFELLGLYVATTPGR